MGMGAYSDSLLNGPGSLRASRGRAEFARRCQPPPGSITKTPVSSRRPESGRGEIGGTELRYYLASHYSFREGYVYIKRCIFGCIMGNATGCAVKKSWIEMNLKRGKSNVLCYTELLQNNPNRRHLLAAYKP